MDFILIYIYITNVYIVELLRELRELSEHILIHSGVWGIPLLVPRLKRCASTRQRALFGRCLL